MIKYGIQNFKDQLIFIIHASVLHVPTNILTYFGAFQMSKFFSSLREDAILLCNHFIIEEKSCVTKNIFTANTNEDHIYF